MFRRGVSKKNWCTEDTFLGVNNFHALASNQTHVEVTTIISKWVLDLQTKRCASMPILEIDSSPFPQSSQGLAVTNHEVRIGI